MRDVLHWLPISERIGLQYRITAMDNGLPLCPWLRALLPPRPLLPSVGFGRTSGAAFCCEGEFLVLRARLAIMQRRAFSVVGPSAWNDLPFELRSLLMAHPSRFYISLKSFFLSVTGLGAPLGSSLLKRCYISHQNE